MWLLLSSFVKRRRNCVLPTLLTKAKLADTSERLYQPAHRCVEEGQRRRLAGDGLEIGGLQSCQSEIALLHIHQQVAHGQERIGTHRHALLLDLERDRGDDRIVRQASGVEGQDGAILLVGDIVAEVEGGGSRIDDAANAAILRRFEDLAVEGCNRIEGQDRPGDRHIDDDAGETAEAVRDLDREVIGAGICGRRGVADDHGCCRYRKLKLAP